MTNEQLLISVSIPSVLILLGWLSQNQRLADFRADVAKQFASVERRMDRTDTRLDRMEGHLGRIDEDLKQFYGSDKLLEGRVNELSARIK